MEKENHGLNELYKYAYSNSMPYEDRLRSTNVDTFKASYSFSTNYLPFKEQLILILKKNITIFLRNTKSLLAIFLSPVIFLLILVFLQILSDNYTQGNIIKEHEINYLDQVSLKCNYPTDCLSLGVAIIVYIYLNRENLHLTRSKI